MKNVLEHIEYVKGKPHHVRRRVAVGAATIGTAIIAFVWLSTSLMTGAFAIQGSSFALSTNQGDVVATTSSASQGLAGAAAAFTNSDEPVHIEIVDATPPEVNKPEPTILPF